MIRPDLIASEAESPFVVNLKPFFDSIDPNRTPASSASVLVGLDIRNSDHLAPLLGFVGDEFIKVGG